MPQTREVVRCILGVLGTDNYAHTVLLTVGCLHIHVVRDVIRELKDLLPWETQCAVVYAGHIHQRGWGRSRRG